MLIFLNLLYKILFFKCIPFHQSNTKNLLKLQKCDISTLVIYMEKINKIFDNYFGLIYDPRCEHKIKYTFHNTK